MQQFRANAYITIPHCNYKMQSIIRLIDNKTSYKTSIKQVLDIAIKLFHNAHVSQLLLENRALQDMINMEE